VGGRPGGGQQPMVTGATGELTRSRRRRDCPSRIPQLATTAPRLNPMASRLLRAEPPGPSTAAGPLTQAADTASDSRAGRSVPRVPLGRLLPAQRHTGTGRGSGGPAHQPP
jgi:hypothetical protein